MKILEVIKNKENFKQIEKKIKKSEKKLNYFEKQGKRIIYKFITFITLMFLFMFVLGMISSIAAMFLLFPIYLFLLFDTTGGMNKFLLYLNEKPDNKKYNTFLHSIYNLKGVGSLFYLNKIEKQFKKDFKNKEIIKCLKAIKNTYKRKKYNKNIYKEILKDSIEENMILDIEENKKAILEEINTFKENDKKELQGALINRIGLDSILDNNQEKNEIVIKKEEVLQNI